ncbi:MAG: zinc-dependent metalloprotease [Phycisphaerae bacterium]
MKTSWMSRAVSACLAASVSMLIVGTAVAQDTPNQNQAPDLPAPKAGKGGEGRDGDDKPKRFPEMSELTKDMKATEGLFTVYRFDTSDKSRDPEKLLAKIPAALINDDMLFATSLSSAGNFSGWMWGDVLFRFEIAGNQLKLVTPDTRFVRKEDAAIADAVKRTYGNTFIAAVPILSMSPSGDVLIDLGGLLKSNIAQVPSPGTVRPDLSEWNKIKVFPDNVLIEVNLAFGERQGGQMAGVAYAFQRLPKLGGYKPREADQRLGYFQTDRIDWTRSNNEREVDVRYINRWQLEKRDPSLELSPPKKPIMFIIEKTVPVQWRRYVRAGVEEWNRAYEKIGFVDAVVVQQQTDDNEWANIDPEDSRYNFVRWTVTGRALAVGPSRADPRTGQILDADIVCDDAWVRFYITNYDVLTTPKGIASLKGPGWDLFLEKFPTLVPEVLKPQENKPVEGIPQLRPPSLVDLPAPHPCNAKHGYCCAYAEGMVEQLATAQFALVATGSGKKLPEHIIGTALKEVIAHEVGHTLGLRHNFKGSAFLPLEELKKRRDSDDPTTASVMDYNPLLIFADDDVTKVKNFVSPALGPYDDWVIEYGYSVPKAGKSEEESLKEIASRATQPGLDYGTDEDTVGVFSPDPYSVRYDAGSNHMDWARSRQELVDKLTKDILTWSIRDGEARYFTTQAFNVLMAQRTRNFQFVARLIGGQTFNRDYKGDPNGRPALVITDPQVQRDALKFLSETLFSDQFVKVSPEVLNNLPASRWGGDLRIDYPIHDRIAAMQASTLVDICSPPVLQRVYDAELKTEDPKKFTAAELITSVRDGIFPQVAAGSKSGPFTDAQPMISSISRNLQKNYLAIMLGAAQLAPGQAVSADLNGMIRFAMRELSDRIGSTLKSGEGGSLKLDFASKAHLSECKDRIDRVLSAQFEAR